MNANRIRGASVILIALMLVGLSSVPADAVRTSAPADAMVIEWNEHAANALIAGAPDGAGQTPPVAVLHLAMVHGAVYDAVNAIDGRYRPYLGAPPAMRWYSKEAAAATAAYRVLVSPLLGLPAPLPATQLTALANFYESSLASIPSGAAKDGGIATGEAAAARMLAVRTGDGRFGPFRFTVPPLPSAGQWRPTLPSFVNDPFAWVARVKPFLIDSASRFASDGPNALTSRRYAKEFAEVKALGSAGSTVRTTDQTNAALFWAQHPGATWSRTFRSLSASRGLSITENARLFAMLYLTAADALISCWDDKARWSFWRPITAIREAATDGNPDTDADPNWLPLIANPPYPEQPSGHTCFSGSVVYTLQDFFRTDRMDVTVVRPDGMTRSFTRFSHIIKEIIDARVWSGIHFRTADLDGAKIGKQVANWRQNHYFQRVNCERDDDDDDDGDRESSERGGGAGQRGENCRR